MGHVAFGQGTIELRRTARLDPTRTLTLSSIADLSGPDALRWAELDLSALTAKPRSPTPDIDAPAEIQWQTITIDQVRGELERQQGIHWGRLSLRGSACNVGIAPAQADGKTPVAPAPSIKPAAEGPRLQELAEARIAQLVGMEPADVRIEFAPQDADLLATSTGGRVIELQPMGKSDRMALSVRMFEQDRVVASGTIRAKVTVRRDVLVLRESIPRGAGLTNDNTTIESRWIGPTEIPADPAGTIGKVAKGKLKAGQMLIPQDVEPIIAAKKGDQVNVDCISGSIILRRTMRALETGREGDTIALAGSNSKMTAQARLSGPPCSAHAQSPRDPRRAAGRTSRRHGHARPPASQSCHQRHANQTIHRRDLARDRPRHCSRGRHPGLPQARHGAGSPRRQLHQARGSQAR
jgi:flagella basal body P-ring formation protein FlgA